MTTRQIHLCLWTIAAALTAGAVAAVPLGFLLPTAAPPLDNRGGGPGPAADRGTVPSLPPLSEFEPVWAHPLRRPLAAPPAGQADAPPDTSTHPASPGEAAPALTLVGTIGNSVALLRIADGSVEAKAAGERIGGAEVVSIRPSHVVLRYNGRNMTLEKPAENSVSSEAAATRP